MSRPVIGRGMYGMYGPITDSGEKEFTAKVAALGVDVGRSPYRDYEVNQIVADFNAAPADAIRLLWGSSLGANNCPVVAAYASRVVIHGMWGFQASDYGSKVPIPGNVLFAHEVYNPAWFETFGLGHYEWVRAANNGRTNLYLSARYDMHPGETEATQAMFLAEMRRVIGKPSDKLGVASHQDYTVVANDLVKFFTDEVHTLPGWEQNFIPMDKIPVAAGAVAKRAVDTLDAYRAGETK